MAGYRELQVWQKAMRLVADAYRISQEFPPEERFGLSQQMRRAAVSVPSNIAEGHGRSGKADFARFLSIARGSLFEFQTQLEIAAALNFVSEIQLESTLSDALEVEKMLTRLMNVVLEQAREPSQIATL